MTISPQTWHHSPAHVFVPNVTYMVTAGTLHKEHLFSGQQKLAALHDTLLRLAEQYKWSLRAWAVLPNHYHWIGVAPEAEGSLETFVRHLHSISAIEINKLDQTPGRKVWFQYWDTCLTYERSYCARLNYVMQNPVRHGLVPIAYKYPFWSARGFEANVDTR